MPVSDEVIDLIWKLRQCDYLPGSYEKRFVRDVYAKTNSSPDPTLTEKQLLFLGQLRYRFRKQLEKK